MYEVRVEAGFCATHQLRLYDGELEPLHGHDWRVEAVFRGPRLDEIGVLIDFVHVEEALRAIVADLHHTCLNEVSVLKGMNPSAEHVALYIFTALRDRLGADAPIVAVHVREAPGCVAAYIESEP